MNTTYKELWVMAGNIFPLCWRVTKSHSSNTDKYANTVAVMMRKKSILDINLIHKQNRISADPTQISG